MTSDGTWPDRFGEKVVEEKINQVIIYIVTYDMIIKDSPML